jgi:hypothetical protein
MMDNKMMALCYVPTIGEIRACSGRAPCGRVD